MKSFKRKKAEVKLKAPSKTNGSLRTIQARLLSDIKQIRKLWAEGKTDRDIRMDLDLGWREWRRRIRIMRSIPADEDTITTYRRYLYEHNKAMEKLQTRLEELHRIKSVASETVPIYGNTVDPKTKKLKLLENRPRDLHLAASIAKDMATIDGEILRKEADLVIIKQRLGMIEDEEPDIFDPFAEKELITAPNVAKAWQLRKQRALERERMKVEEAVLINGEEKKQVQQ